MKLESILNWRRGKDTAAQFMDVETDPSAFAKFDCNSRLVSCNAAFRALYRSGFEALNLFEDWGQAGYEDLIRAQAKTALADEEADDYVAARVQDRQGTHSRSADYEIPGAGWHRVTMNPAEDDCFCIRYVDVSDLKRREMELEETLQETDRQSALLKEATQSMNHGLLIHGGDEILLTNDRLSEILGIPKHEMRPGVGWKHVVRHFLAEREGFAPHEIDDRVANVTDSQDVGVYERRLIDGTWIRVDLEWRAEGGKMVTFTDVTEAKAREAALAAMIDRIAKVSSAIDDAMSEISTGMSDLSSRTEDQAHSLEQTSTAMGELSATVRQSAANAAEVNTIALAAEQNAVKGGNVVEQAASAMGLIEVSSNKIGDITGILEEISFQTNLLAVNVSVEAAHVGDQGRGFAVLANETRALSQRAGVAAKDIKQLIASSSEHVAVCSKLLNEARVTLEDSVASAKDVAQQISEIAAVNRAQTESIEQASRAISSADDQSQQNASLVEETSGAILSAVDQMEILRKEAGFADETRAPQVEERSHVAVG